MKHAAQVELFRTIPGLERPGTRVWADCATAPSSDRFLLDRQLRLKSAPHIRFAGQITGCELMSARLSV
ncbi:MAG: FAD-dependent oxidoreductase [Sphingomonadales bacterium]|nr:FAD-dependent oxidoreductase [Sphingomonadales bacterium]